MDGAHAAAGDLAEQAIAAGRGAGGRGRAPVAAVDGRTFLGGVGVRQVDARDRPLLGGETRPGRCRRRSTTGSRADVERPPRRPASRRGWRRSRGRRGPACRLRWVERAAGRAGQAPRALPPCFLEVAGRRVASTARWSSASRSPRATRCSASGRALSSVHAWKAPTSLAWSIRPIWSASKPKRAGYGRRLSSAMGRASGRSCGEVRSIRPHRGVPAALTSRRPTVVTSRRQHSQLCIAITSES